MENEATYFAPLPTTREERGRQIARGGGIRQLGSRYVVPAQSAHAAVPAYVVDLVDESCTCPDYETRRRRCKHVEAAYFWLTAGPVNDGVAGVDEEGVVVATAKKRKTYPQNWPAYDAAQATERERVPVLLRSLCDQIQEPPRDEGTPGRKPIPLREGAYAIVTKVYSLLSSRRATSDIQRAYERGHLSRVWDHNTLIRVMEDPRLTEVLTWLVEEAAAPLAVIEAACGQYAADSTGIGTVTYQRWFDVKHRRERSRQPFLKLHFLCGTATHAIAGVKVTSAADCPTLPALIKAAASHHDMKEISADKAYLAGYNLNAIVDVGATPFIPFKIDSRDQSRTSPHWRRMHAHYTLMADDWMAHYHRRSNAETVVSMIKRNFGGSVRSKLADAQVNEILCKCLLHNLQRIVHLSEEIGIAIDVAPRLTAVP